MQRFTLEQLIHWKDSPHKKPLIVEGARQVGKTWLMKEFGNSCYQQSVYINFDQEPNSERAKRLQSIFTRDLHPQRIIRDLEIEYDVKIDPATSLLIFDEIQELPRALSSLKYFNEDAPQYQIVAAGSQMGIALHQGTSFPVGKVSFLRLYPMDFKEFLAATGNERYLPFLLEQDWDSIATFREAYVDLLKTYLCVGGMPEAVASFVEHADFESARAIHREIIRDYELDFSKHAPVAQAPRLREVWNSIPRQLAKENRKFVWGIIRDGGRGRDYEFALQWLKDCGLIHKVAQVAKAGLPLKAYEDSSIFKAFLLDVGLLSTMSGLDYRVVRDSSRLFEEFKGTLTEQYVLQQLVTAANRNGSFDEIHYWATGSAEIDFIMQINTHIVPIEVKASENLKAKSLKNFLARHNSSTGVRTSLSNYRREESFTNIPLYAISEIYRIFPE
jgi:predicted AAA+ superfamily ATPase